MSRRAILIDPSRAGYSAIELVFAILAASILSMTAGILVFLGHVGWRNNMEAVNLQRDATFAMDFISHTIRPATRTEVAATNTVTTGRIDVGSTANATRSIYWDDDDLYYDPSAAVSGDEIVLVRDKVSTFAPQLSDTESGPGVAVDLVLIDGESRVTLHSLTCWRN